MLVSLVLDGLERLIMFMPSNTQDNTNNLASIEAYNAALEAQAGVADHVFQQLCAHSASINDELARKVSQADAIYPGNVGSLARSNDINSGGKFMRTNCGKQLSPNKMGCPSEGRLSAKPSLPKGHLFLAGY
jgi:hypothetical protein